MYAVYILYVRGLHFVVEISRFIVILLLEMLDLYLAILFVSKFMKHVNEQRVERQPIATAYICTHLQV